MADLMNEVIEQATEAMENSGMDVTVLEPVTEKSGSILKTALTFLAGTGFGAGCVVLGKKAAEAIKANKDEINAEKKNARTERLRKKVEKAQKELDELLGEEDEEDLDDEDFEEEDVVEE